MTVVDDLFYQVSLRLVICTNVQRDKVAQLFSQTSFFTLLERRTQVAQMIADYKLVLHLDIEDLSIEQANFKKIHNQASTLSLDSLLVGIIFEEMIAQSKKNQTIRIQALRKSEQYPVNNLPESRQQETYAQLQRCRLTIQEINDQLVCLMADFLRA